MSGLAARLWRHRRWWLTPLLVAAALLALLWFTARDAPLGRYIYGPF